MVRVRRLENDTSYDVVVRSTTEINDSDPLIEVNDSDPLIA